MYLELRRELTMNGSSRAYLPTPLETVNAKHTRERTSALSAELPSLGPQ